LPLGISIVKTANPTSGGPGDPVTYTYVVKNTGQVDLINVAVDDDKLGHVGTIASLKVGESKTLTFNTHLPNAAGLLTNVGTAVGHDRFGRTAKATDNATVIVVLPIFLPRTGSDGRFPAAAGFAFLGIGIAILTITRKRHELAVDEIEDDQV
jgi:LPXTG-motif cell wall-anchored protein